MQIRLSTSRALACRHLLPLTFPRQHKQTPAAAYRSCSVLLTTKTSKNALLIPFRRSIAAAATITKEAHRAMVNVSKEDGKAETIEDSSQADTSADDEKDASFIVRFYGKTKASDAEGRTLNDICAYSSDELEYHHDYIQILFPLPERSPVNPDAPLITKVTRDAFLEKAYLRKSFFRAFTCMACFYGFDVDGDETAPTLTPKANFKKIARNSWLTYMDHNHLRITRIIRALRILGLDAAAQAFYKALGENAQGVSPRSLMYWERAAKRPLYLPPDQPDNSSKIIAWLKDD